MKLKTLIACGAAVLFIHAAPVMASTPDGMTPAEEDVCDGLIGQTPGLYGLCVAYCEAQDLDQFGQEKTSNRRLLDAYEKKRLKGGGPPMPCHNPMPDCACWTEAELETQVNTSGFCMPAPGSLAFLVALDPTDPSIGGAISITGIGTSSGECGNTFNGKGPIELITSDEVDACAATLQVACDGVLPPGP